MEKQSAEINLIRERKKAVLGLVVVTVAVSAFCASIIGLEDNRVYYDLVRIITIAAAAFLSLVVFTKQGYRGLFGRAYTALAGGLVLYLAAELTWAYLALSGEITFPSLADVFYLAGYVGFGYNQFSLYKFYGKGVKRSAYYIVIPAVIILAILFFQSLVSLYGLSNQEDILPVALRVTYPILDSVIFIPAILIILNSWKGQLTFIPWIFVSWVLSGSADILFAYMEVPELEFLRPAVTMIYNAAYLTMSAGLVWYLRFFISGEKKILKY